MGSLYFGMEAFRIASRDRLIPAALEGQLRHTLDKVKSSLDAAKYSLECVSENTAFGRARYTLWRGNGSKHQLDRIFQDLRLSCDEVARLHLQFSAVSTSRSSHLLPAGFLKLKHETADSDPRERLPNSEIVVAEGNRSLNHERVNSRFVLERKTSQDENDLQFLSGRLFDRSRSAGLLELLGYRKPVYIEPGFHDGFELVFELPMSRVCESLANQVVSTPTPGIVERLRLCQAVANAVVSVHGLQLVHKAIRSRTILILTDTSTPAQGYSVYLQDWSHVRELSGATSQYGSDDNWPKRIYQHPERQSTMVDEAFEARHDIYSLGVCMLEILLWTPFVIEKMDSRGQVEHDICQVFETRGLALGAQGVGVGDGGLPARYKGNPSKLADNARATCAIWKDITRTSLQDDEAHVILGCLEGSFATASEVSDVLQVMIRALE
jgi:hypothetical protein